MGFVSGELHTEEQADDAAECGHGEELAFGDAPALEACLAFVVEDGGDGGEVYEEQPAEEYFMEERHGLKMGFGGVLSA